MDINDIKTVEQAKSLAYDQMVLLEQAQRNIQVLNAKIIELEKDSAKKEVKE